MKRGQTPLKKDRIPQVTPLKAPMILSGKDIGELVAEAEERVRQFLDNYMMARRISYRSSLHRAKGSSEKQCN